MELATSADSVAAFAEELLAPSGWHVDSVRRSGTRLEPPDSYWSIFSVDICKDGEERNLRAVARGAFHQEAWDALSARLMPYAGLP